MKKAQKWFRFILSLNIIFFLSISSITTHAMGAPFMSDENRTFALELYNKIKTEKGNIVVSPLSLSMVFAMTYLGAKNETKEEMKKVLHFKSDKKLHDAFRDLQAYYRKTASENRLTLSNSLWAQEKYDFLKSFIENSNRYYNGGFFRVDFAKKPDKAKKAINAWVNEKTNKKIPKMISDGVIDPSTTLILCNAVHFKGFWKNRFDASKTTSGEFFTDTGKTVSIPFMNTEDSYKHKRLQTFSALQLPYENQSLSMIIFLPHKKNGLNQLEENLSIAVFDQTVNELMAQSPEKINVSLPKFKAFKSLELSKTLKDMGMRKAFENADFSGMTGKKDLFIGQVIHKATIDVNEEGSEAAGASAVIMYRSVSRPKAFKANHPFLFFIYDQRKQNILFMGRLSTP